MLHFPRIVISGLALSMLASAADKPAAHESRLSPQIARLAKAFVGTWNNTESMERSELYPSGGQRKGVSSCRLATHGTNLVCEGDSNGSAGPLHYLIVIWWDKDANIYRVFTCFEENNSSLCKVRGTANWEGESFVNNYTEEENGKKVNMRDTFTEIKPGSHALIAAVEESPGKMRTLITTRSTRR